jgi:hypothetical protein
MVVDSMYILFGGAPGIGADQTQRYAEDLIGSAGDEIYLKGSTQLGSAGGVMSWSNDGTADWGIGAVAFKPAAGDASPGSNVPGRMRGFKLQQIADAEDEGRFNEIDVRNWWRMGLA